MGNLVTGMGKTGIQVRFMYREGVKSNGNHRQYD